MIDNTVGHQALWVVYREVATCFGDVVIEWLLIFSTLKLIQAFYVIENTT